MLARSAILSWNTIFKAASEVAKVLCTEKLCFAVEIRQESARFSPWDHDQMPSADGRTA
jgi:hypothetical protein